MNRIFHTRITWYQYLYILLLGALTFFLMWDKMIIMATFCALLLIILIERFIHTIYTITPDGKLIISTGRFSKSKTVYLKDIREVQKRNSVKIAGFSTLRYILIRYNIDNYVSVLPVKEQEFIDLLDERRKNFLFKE